MVVGVTLRRRKDVISSLAIFLSMSLLMQSAIAQEEEKSIDDYYVDFAVPGLTPLTVLGMNSNKVSRPGNLKEFAVELLNVSNASSDISSGIAVEWAPVRPTKSLNTYRESCWKYLQVGVGTAKIGDATNVGLSLRWNLVDQSDPLANEAYTKSIGTRVWNDAHVLATAEEALSVRKKFMDTVGVFIVELLEELPHDSLKVLGDELIDEIWNVANPPEPLYSLAQELRVYDFLEKKNPKRVLDGADSATIEQFSELYIAAVIKHRKLKTEEKQVIDRIVKEEHDRFKEKWNAAVVNVGAGLILSSDNSSWKALRGERVAGLLGAAFPLGRPAQGVVQVDGRFAVQDNVDEESFWGVGARILFGMSDRRISFEAYYSQADSLSADHAKLWRFTVGTEVKLAKGVWFELAIGSEVDPESSKGSRILSLGGIKYGFRKEPRFQVSP